METAMTKIDSLKAISPLRADQMLTYSLPHLAVASDLSLRNLYNKIREGKLRVHRVGGRTLVFPDDAMRFLRGEPMADVVETRGQAQKPAHADSMGAGETKIEGAEVGEPMARAPGDEPAGPSTDSAGDGR